jgi:excisionase family DNA binding protein
MQNISVKEAAARLGISRQRVHALLASGQLRGERVDVAGVIVWTVEEASVTERKEVGRPEAA